MKKTRLLWMLCMIVILWWCTKKVENSQEFIYIKNANSDIYITWEIDEAYPSLTKKYSEWALYLAPDKHEICYMTGKKINCVSKNSKVIVVTNNKKDLDWYLQILKKSNPDFIGLNYILDESKNKVFLYYNELNNSNPDLQRNMFEFMINLPAYQIHKINGWQTSEPYITQLMSVQGNYIITMDWDGNNKHLPSADITDYTIGRWYYSYNGTWWIINPKTMTVTYRPFLPKCWEVDPNRKILCDKNNDTIMRRSKTSVTKKFTSNKK